MSGQESLCNAESEYNMLCASAGDLLTVPLSISGRVLAAQFSVLTTFPCVILIFKVLPTTAASGIDAMFAPYAVILFFAGVLTSW